MLEIFLLMVRTKEEEKDDIQKYRNDYKWGREHGLIPSIPYPKWMKK